MQDEGMWGKTHAQAGIHVRKLCEKAPKRFSKGKPEADRRKVCLTYLRTASLFYILHSTLLGSALGRGLVISSWAKMKMCHGRDPCEALWKKLTQDFPQANLPPIGLRFAFGKSFGSFLTKLSDMDPCLGDCYTSPTFVLHHCLYQIFNLIYINLCYQIMSHFRKYVLWDFISWSYYYRFNFNALSYRMIMEALRLLHILQKMTLCHGNLKARQHLTITRSAEIKLNYSRTSKRLSLLELHFHVRCVQINSNYLWMLLDR